MVTPQPVVRTRSEGQGIRPFKGLECFEAMLDDARLHINTGYDEIPVSLYSELPITRASLPSVGIRLQLAEDDSDFISKVNHAATESGIPIDSISIVIISMSPGSSPIPETEVLDHRLLEKVGMSWQIISHGGGRRPRLMTNVQSGFELHVVTILNKDLDPKPLRPRLKGTVLASASVAFSVLDSASGIVPKELTAEIRTDNDLPPSVWFFVKKLDEYLHAESLSDAFEVYVDARILQQHQLLSGGPRRLAEHVFITPALTEIIMDASRELADSPDYEFKGTQSSSSVLRLIYSKVKEMTSGYLDPSDFQDQLRDDPNRTVALALAARGRASHTMKDALVLAITEMIGDNELLADITGDNS